MDQPEALDLNHHGTLSNGPVKNDENTKKKGHRRSKNRHSKSSKTKVSPESKVEEKDEGLLSSKPKHHLSEHHSMEREESAPDSGLEVSNVIYPTQGEEEPTKKKGHRRSKNRHSKSSKTKVSPESKEEKDEGLLSSKPQHHLSEHHSMEREESAPELKKKKGHRRSKNRHSKSSKTKVSPEPKEEKDEGLSSKPQHHLSEHHSMEREESAPDSGLEVSNAIHPTQGEEELTFDVEALEEELTFDAETLKVLSEMDTLEAPAVEITETISVPMGQVSAQATRPKTSEKAVASLVYGIIGIFVFGFYLGPVAICLGSSALGDIRRNPEKVEGTCQAQGGIICGVVDILLWVVGLVVGFLLAL